MLASLLALAVAQSACNPPPGTTEMLDGGQRFVILGESHGTTETPAAFAEVVCEVAQRGPVTVAVELPEAMQDQLNAFLIADDNTAAVAALSGTSFINPRMTDGRSSRAMLDMLLALRRLKVEGRDVAIHAFQPSSAIALDLPQAYYELQMGHRLAQAATTRPGSRVLALAGSIHARKTGIANAPDLGLPAAAHLPTNETLVLSVAQQGGEAWNCRAECGVQLIPTRYDAEARGVIMGAYGDGAYDGVLALGPTTASPPINSPAD